MRAGKEEKDGGNRGTEPRREPVGPTQPKIARRFATVAASTALHDAVGELGRLTRIWGDQHLGAVRHLAQSKLRRVRAGKARRPGGKSSAREEHFVVWEYG